MPGHQLLVSVVIPVYNRGKLIEETIDSVMAQSYKHLELILVDDGSTDDSREIIEQYKSRISLPVKLYCIKNVGPGGARNFGITKAAGELIAPLDSDDLWNPDFVETCVELFYKKPEIDFVFSNFIHFNKDNGWESKPKFDTLTPLFDNLPREKIGDYGWFIKDGIFTYLLQEMPVFHSCIIYKKQLVIEAGPYPELWQADIGNEDWHFILRCARTGSFAQVNNVMTKIRRHESNFSSNAKKHRRDGIKVLDKALVDFQLSGEERNIVNQQIALRSFEFGYYCFENNDHKQARQWFFRSFSPNCLLKKVIYYLSTFLPVRFINIIRSIKAITII